MLLLLPLVVIAAGYLWLRSSLPVNEGRLVLPGLAAEVRITRDAQGIPTISAASERDAAFALGVLHAQDRLFQMDLMRRFGAGRLSEWFGPATLRADRFSRTLGLYRLAELQYQQLAPELRVGLDAYAAGVNAYLAQRHALPPEYYLLDATPEPWRPADSLVWGKIIAIQLSGNFRGELLHARLIEQQHLTPEQLAVLYPPYPKDAPVALGDASKWLEGLPLDRIYASLPPIVGPQSASNNWVVDGSHTVSGKPLLANDPHLDYTAPGPWYLARIEAPGLAVAGITSPGVPIVVIGHNARIAWGFTTTGSDVEDLFIERVDPDDAARYLTPDGAQPFATRQEEIRVRGAAPVALTVRATRHGPVISDLGTDYGQPAAGTALALQATWLAADDRSPEALWAVNHAGNWSEFRGAFQRFVAPQQNIVYADVDGNIGFIAPARVPIRARGDGWLPVPGWSGEYDWTGYIPFDQLPQGFNPPSGRFVSANNKIVPDSYPYLLTRNWDLPNRAERINALLDAVPKQSPDSTATMQADTLSLMAKDLLPLMLQAPPASKQAGVAIERLKAWDGRMDRNQAAPLIFAAWLREFTRTVLADKLGAAFDDYWGMHPDVVHLVLTEHTEWCDDRGTQTVESCDVRLAAALERALAQLGEAYGRDINAWRWGKAHEAQFTGLLWSRVPVLGGILGLHLPADGGYDTVNSGATPIRSADHPFADVHGPTLRMIVDLSDIDATQFMIAPGESGNPLSRHYSDLMRPWRDSVYLRLGESPRGTLVLAPP
ncbi:MAG TPA: penicillin acylase family protein [Stellaceae bacterium]